jgi:hypothetical protein
MMLVSAIGDRRTAIDFDRRSAIGNLNQSPIAACTSQISNG